MTAFAKIFGSCDETAPAGAAHRDIATGAVLRNVIAKRGIVARIAAHGDSTIAALATELAISVPTAAKLVEELVEEGVAVDLGKVETTGGRRPNIYGLAGGAAYFAGVAIGEGRLELAIADLENQTVAKHSIENFALEDDPRTLETILAETEAFISGCAVARGKIFAAGVSLPGRVNTSQGESYGYFADPAHPLGDVFAGRLGMEVSVENATRVKCYAQYVPLIAQNVRNMLYIDMGRELTVGIVTDGKLYYGKSGFAGEFGHAPFFDNNVICSCGRRGCLDTEVSGFAVGNRMRGLIRNGENTVLRDKKDGIHIDDIVDAAVGGDTLSIELIEDAAAKTGRGIALLINVFDPDTIVIGGSFSRAGDYLMLPLRAAVNKHSANAISGQTAFRIADNIGAAEAAALMIRNKTTGLL